MQYLGIEYNMKHTPKLDQQFVPFGVWRAACLKDAKKPIAIAVERDKGRVSVHHTCIHGTPEMARPTTAMWSAISSCCGPSAASG